MSKLIDGLGFTPGNYKVIRVSGEEQVITEKPSIRKLGAAIKCDTVDTVTLSRKPAVVMIVDDTGMIDGKPVNEKATVLVRIAFGQQYPYSIHGDVAVAFDIDFE